ncbi:MAG: PorT family protein [Bacteroidetes bacterium]|nr:PorT family protein [Bacteroidota bacterium]
MKKLILGAAVLCGTFAMAQKIGVKAGGNLSSISENDTKSQFGFYAGLYLNSPINSKLSIQPEVVYSLQGAEVTGLPSGVTGNLNLGYINIPVMFQYTVAQDLFVEAGPQFGFLVDATLKATAGGYTVKQDVKNQMNTFDFGIGAGLGYNFTPNLSMNARYIAGVTNIVKNNSGDSVRNNVFQLGLGYTFK